MQELEQKLREKNPEFLTYNNIMGSIALFLQNVNRHL